MQLRTDGTPSIRSSVTSLWGPKAVDHLVDLDVSFVVRPERKLRYVTHYATVTSVIIQISNSLTLNLIPRITDDADDEIEVRVKGLVSKYWVW